MSKTFKDEYYADSLKRKDKKVKQFQKNRQNVKSYLRNINIDDIEDDDFEEPELDDDSK